MELILKSTSKRTKYYAALSNKSKDTLERNNSIKAICRTTINDIFPLKFKSFPTYKKFLSYSLLLEDLFDNQFYGEIVFSKNSRIGGIIFVDHVDMIDFFTLSQTRKWKTSPLNINSWVILVKKAAMKLD